MNLEKFDDIYQRAAERKGGEAKLEALLSKPLTQAQIAAIPDDRWLSAFSMKNFAKWHFLESRAKQVAKFRRSLLWF